MKICVLSANFPPMPWPCGAADFVSQLSRWLAQNGNDVTVCTSNVAAQADDGLKVHVVPGSWSLAHVRRVAKWLEQERFDVVDMQYESNMYGDRWPVLLTPFLLGNHAGKKVLTLHSQALPRVGGRWWRPLQLSSFDATVFFSGVFQANMLRRFPRRKPVFYLQPFPSNITRVEDPALATFLAKLRTAYLGGEFLLLYFGGITPNRGLEDVLESLRVLGDDGRAIHLVLVGQFNPEEDSYQRELVARVRRYGLEHRVSFLGRLSNDEVSRMFQAADACVLPFPEGASFKNGSLSAALEHAAAIITTITDASDRELSNGAVQAYRPGDVGALTEILQKMTRNPEIGCSLRKASAQMREQLSWDKYIRERLQIYGELTGNSGQVN